MSWIHYDEKPVKPLPLTMSGVAVQRAVQDELTIAWLGMGLTIAEIAGNLKRSDKTVEFRWARLKREHGFQCYQDATRYAMVHQLIPFKV